MKIIKTFEDLIKYIYNDYKSLLVNIPEHLDLDTVKDLEFEFGTESVITSNSEFKQFAEALLEEEDTYIQSIILLILDEMDTRFSVEVLKYLLEAFNKLEEEDYSIVVFTTNDSGYKYNFDNEITFIK